MRLVTFVLSFVFYCSTLVPVVQSFDFQVGTPQQCDDFTVTWSGGSPPFTLTVVIPGGDNLDFNIPSNAFQNNQGSFSTQLPVAKSTSILFAMSDASGALTGGTSKLLVVGDSSTGATCNTTLPANDFFFTVDSSPTECGSYHYTLYDAAILPVSIFFYVPGGHESFVITPISTTSFTWNTNLTAQTSFISTMVDSQNRRGGTDVLKTVASSNDQSCIIASNPSGTTSASSSSPTSTSTSTSSPTSTSSSLGRGAIIGIAVGAVAILGLATVLAFCFIRRRKSNRQDHSDIDLLAGEPAGLYAQRPTPSDLSGSPASSQPMLSNQYTPNPYTFTSMNQPDQRPYPAKSTTNQPYQEYQQQAYEPEYYPRPMSNVTSYPPPPSSSSASGQGSSGAAVSSVKFKGTSPAGTTNSSTRRLVVHTDIEDDELEELPPQYSDRRAPIQSISMQEAGIGGGSGGGSESRVPVRSMSMRKS
ncbi:hypothetical protein D9757_013613 [Collybiopsis confluens]|uniref:Uncharacterized protein n=1 Tax=Collybiopsis confluens TaxID=2823264 RepID=A0A8H5CYY5_9AGAR|nr:hypothetical protein D9757_013613 [Collybiopsis confluens]